jgi:hypothetical protein
MSIFYLDQDLGNDATTATPLGWWSVDVTAVLGSAPAAGETATGGVSGSTAVLTVQPGSWSGVVTCYFYGKSAAFSAETLTFTGGATGTIAGDFTYCAWKTITSGATTARIAAGDTVRIAKSAAPYSIGTGVWTGNTIKPATVNIVSSTNATPIVVTATAHGLVNGDIVQVLSHTTNTKANGVWVVANKTADTFELTSSVGNGVGGASGTVRNVNYKSVVLSTAQALPVDNCEVAWTSAGSSTTTTSATAKEGSTSASMQKTSPSTTTLYAYRTITSVNLSAYQKLTFWIRPSVAITAGQWTITLCSDTAGVTAVDTFAIPALPGVAWYPLNILSNGAGNLGSAIQSIGLKTGATTPATITILLDNICATTTTGLNMSSVISKNSSEQGGTEPWLPIQSINRDGKILIIDNDPSFNFSTVATQGYSGTSESVTTYARETTKTAFGTLSSTVIAAPQNDGTFGNLIAYEGGYNTATNSQSGETLFDGSNGLGHGFNTNSKSFIRLNYCSLFRYQIGYINVSPSAGLEIGIMGDLNAMTSTALSLVVNSPGMTITSLRNVCNNDSIPIDIRNYGNVISSIGNINCNGNTGLVFAGGLNTKILSITNINANGANGIAFSNSGINVFNTYVKVTNIKYNVGSGVVTFGAHGNNKVYGATFSGNVTSSVAVASGGTLFFDTCTLSDSSTVSTMSNYLNNQLVCFNYGGVAGDHRIFTDNGAIITDTTTRHTASDFSWKFSPTTLRTAWYPLKMKIAEVPFNASAQVTFKAWVKLDHATNIAARLICYGGQVAGVASDVTVSKAADTNWEELTLTFTPTEQKVVEIWMETWYVAGNSNAYVDDITVTQA